MRHSNHVVFKRRREAASLFPRPPTVNHGNLAWPDQYYASTLLRVSVYHVMHDLYHQRVDDLNPAGPYVPQA